MAEEFTSQKMPQIANITQNQVSIIIATCFWPGYWLVRTPPAHVVTVDRHQNTDYVDPESDLYDSCVNNVKNPTVFVIFDNDQCYPEYIIKYFTLESADGIRRGASAFSALSSAVSRRLGRHIQRTKPAYPKVQRPPKPLPSPPRKDQRILAFVLSL